MKLVVFLGYRNSGKTTSIEQLTKALVKAGFRVGTVKHIHERSFSIDTPGKDTWRHSRAGASVVVAVAPHQLTVMRKRDASEMELSEILETIANDNVDFVLVEGLYGKVERSGVATTYVLCANNERQAAELLRLHPKVACITGKVAEGKRGKSFGAIPYLQLPRDMRRLLGIIDS